MRHSTLYEMFRHFEGQPVQIFTTDERIQLGIVIKAFECAVKLIDEFGRLKLVEYNHITTVIEPQMRLHNIAADFFERDLDFNRDFFESNHCCCCRPRCKRKNSCDRCRRCEPCRNRECECGGRDEEEETELEFDGGEFRR